MPRFFLLLLALWACALPALGQAPAPANPAEPETRRCEDRIASVQRDALTKYDTALLEMQGAFQKAADLESALAVRAERQRLGQENRLATGNFVADPKALRTLQTQTVSKMHELITQLVDEAVPHLVELKKTLTVAGRLDEALAVRGSIEHLQSGFLPSGPVAAGTLVSAEAVAHAYAADRGRADTLYKGQRLTLSGVVAGWKAEGDGRNYLIYLAGGAGAPLVQCAFGGNDHRFREENQFGKVFLVANWGPGNASVLKIERGAALNVIGQCTGFEEDVRLAKCSFPR